MRDEASGLGVDDALEPLRAIAEATRLRILAVLRHGELTVTDLTEILGQSQPRVSRHLKLLVDAGLVTKHREGSWVFFRLLDAGPRLSMLAAVLDTIDGADQTLVADVGRLENVRARRAGVAHHYFD
jgi:DNA-binding transcriptional ArsR family regulator